MRRGIVGAVAVVLPALLCTVSGPAAPPASAGGPGDDRVERDECVYTAHGSRAAEHQNEKALRAGGGKPSPSCAKTFARWTSPTISVWIDSTGGPPEIDPTTFEDYARAAFTEWACHSSLDETVVVTYLASASGADVTIAWGDLGANGILGQAATSYFFGVISHSDITMNSDQTSFTWTAGPLPSADGLGCGIETANGITTGSDYDLLSVLTHEVGHALGVSHPTNRCRTADGCYPATMYSCTASEEWMRRALDPGDVTAISSLYR